MITYSPRFDSCLYIVLDGIGGTSSGEVASKLAAEKTVEYFKEHFEENSDNVENLKLAVKYANRCVYEMNKQNKVYRDMGTTISLLYIDGDVGYHISIGDTRIYEVKKDGVIQITEDDTYVNALVKDNIISKEEAKEHPERHVLLRALGVTRSINFDVNEIKNIVGRKYIICTDGITGACSDEEIFDCISKSKPDEVCHKLVEKANNNGGFDNITVMYIEV